MTSDAINTQGQQPEMAVRFGGIWPAMLTPMAADGRPDWQACERLVEVFVGQRLDGIYVTGSTGQWPLLHIEERKAIAACVVSAAAKRLPVMVHVGAMTTADAVELAEHAATIGAAAISAVVPVYYTYSADAVFAYFRRLAAVGLPFFAYYLGGVTRLDLGPSEFADRLMDIPHVAGMKVTDHDLYTFGLIHARAGNRLRLFSGADELLCHAVLSGACGAIGTFYNVWGPACQTARRATETGDIAYARRFMTRFQAAIAEVLAGGMWSFLRAAVRRKYGIDVGMPRPPLGAADHPWDDTDVERLLQLVDEAGPEP